MRIDERFLGDPLSDPYKVKIGMKVLWLLDRTSRARHPYIGGDILEAEVLSYPWSNGKVLIRAKVGFKATVRHGALHEDKRQTQLAGRDDDTRAGTEVRKESGTGAGGSSEPGDELRRVQDKSVQGVPHLTSGSRGLAGPDSKT